MKINLVWAVLIALVAGVGGGFAGFKIAEANPKSQGEPEPVAEVKAEVPAPVKVAKAEPKVDVPTLTDADIENLIAEVEEDPEEKAEEMKRWGERSKRWANFSTDQRRVWRKAFFSALADVDGLEEVEDAVKAGKLDPEQFRINNVEDIADRMEFYTETMDEEAINTEMTKTLEGIVNQANAQMKTGGE